MCSSRIACRILMAILQGAQILLEFLIINSTRWILIAATILWVGILTSLASFNLIGDLLGLFNVAFELVQETIGKLFIYLWKLRKYSFKELPSVLWIVYEPLLHSFYSMNAIYRRFNGVDWVRRIELVIAVIVNNVILLVVLFVICVEWLINYIKRLLLLLFIIILFVFILHNIYWAFDINNLILIRVLPGHLTLCGFAFIQKYQWPIEIVWLILSWLILLGNDRDVVIVVANTEGQVIRWLVLDHRLS